MEHVDQRTGVDQRLRMGTTGCCTVPWIAGLWIVRYRLLQWCDYASWRVASRKKLVRMRQPVFCCNTAAPTTTHTFTHTFHPFHLHVSVVTAKPHATVHYEFCTK